MEAVPANRRCLDWRFYLIRGLAARNIMQILGLLLLFRLEIQDAEYDHV